MEYLAAIGLKPYLADTYRTQARPQSLIHDPICAETTEDIIRQTFAAINDRRLMEMHASTPLGHEVTIIEPYDLDLRNEAILTYREHVTGRWSCVPICDVDFAIFLGSHYLPEDIPKQQALL